MESDPEAIVILLNIAQCAVEKTRQAFESLQISALDLQDILRALQRIDTTNLPENVARSVAEAVNLYAKYDQWLLAIGAFSGAPLDF